MDKNKLLRNKLIPVIKLITEEIKTFRNLTRSVDIFDKLLKSTVGEWTSVYTNQNGDKIIFDDGEGGYNFDVQLDMIGLDNFDMTYRLGDTAKRYRIRSVSSEDVKEWIKKHLKDRTKETEKQTEINKKKISTSLKVDDLKEEPGDDGVDFGTSRAKEAKHPSQWDKVKEINKNAEQSVKDLSKDRPKGEDKEREMEDSTKFKKQSDAKTYDPKEVTNKAAGTNIGKVSKKKEMPVDGEKPSSTKKKKEHFQKY